MKRSAMDEAVSGALDYAAVRQFELPAFAYWGRQDWLDRVEMLIPTLERGLGWDVTDFGSGDFAAYGLTLCTLRNGTLSERDAGIGQTFAEKVMLVRVDQETPFHLHNFKTEDIINRGGGVLRVEIYPAAHTAAGQVELGGGQVTTLVDGIQRVVAAGKAVDLAPGQSIQVPRGCLHRFWAVRVPVLAAEVSCVNDDLEDNLFLMPGPRYPQIEEDSPARFLLVAEYEELLRQPLVTESLPISPKRP
ncbi:MAG: D-lyxose/D-mannose family sugar isomerase [Propionibacteriaceae bacterium]|jgi:D-lyxose ketol-isomerase|nr:D-lyxose/D-mannose family sugar isomerase [Propionibacteriaceae bacterium]